MPLYLEPPLKTNCSRPPPGFADTNRTQNLFTTGYLIGLTQLQQAGSMVFNLDGVFNDSTPIIPNESILLIQPLSQCPVCRLVYMDTTVSLELLTPLVQHNLRHVQVFYNTLRQNMFLKSNPAAADMLNIFNNAASITSLLSSTPGAQNLSVSPNVLPKFPVPQTVNTIHFDNSLPGTSSVVPNNVLQSLNHVTSDPTLPTLNSVHISNSFNTSRSDKCNVLEISSDTVLPTTYSHPSNMHLELTDVIGSQLDDTVTEQRYDDVVTSRTMTDLTPQLINPSRIENLERNHENILEVSESGTVIESKSLLSNDYTKPVTEMATQPVKLNLASVNKQCVLEPVNVGTMTSVYNMHNLQSQDIDTTYHKFISTGVNTLPNNKSGASAGEPQDSHVDNTVISRFIEPEIYDMLESDFDIFMSSQQMNTESIPPANPHISGRLMETVQTCICKKCGRANNKCDHSTVVCQQEISTSTILPFNKEQCNYSDYKVHNTFRSSLDTFSEPRSTESLSPGSLHISDRLTETVRTGICKKCGVPSTDCYNTESHQEEISAAPSLPSVLSRKNSCGSEISHSSDTCVESLSELEIIPESCANNLKTKTTKPKGIPGRSFSKRIY